MSLQSSSRSGCRGVGISGVFVGRKESRHRHFRGPVSSRTGNRSSYVVPSTGPVRCERPTCTLPEDRPLSCVHRTPERGNVTDSDVRTPDIRTEGTSRVHDGGGPRCDPPPFESLDERLPFCLGRDGGSEGVHGVYYTRYHDRPPTTRVRLNHGRQGYRTRRDVLGTTGDNGRGGDTLSPPKVPGGPLRLGGTPVVPESGDRRGSVHGRLGVVGDLQRGPRDPGRGGTDGRHRVSRAYTKGDRDPRYHTHRTLPLPTPVVPVVSGKED